MEWIKNIENGVAIKIRAIPRSSKNGVQGIHDNTLKIKLTSAPVDGKANKALIAFLSKSLGVAKTNITLASGKTNKNKTIQIIGITKQDVTKKLNI